MKIAVSFLTSYYSKEKTIELITKTNADFIHVDIMDGGFVNHKNTELNFEGLLENVSKPLDIHLMCFDPIIYIKKLSILNPQYITFHLEATKDIVKTIEEIKMLGIKVGMALKPNTEVNEIKPYLALVDLVLVMSVEPGAGGQEFQEMSIKKIKELKNIREENNLKYAIEVDGGINATSINMVKDVDIAVVGSYVCKSNNYQQQIDNLK